LGPLAFQAVPALPFEREQTEETAGDVTDA